MCTDVEVWIAVVTEIVFSERPHSSLAQWEMRGVCRCVRTLHDDALNYFLACGLQLLFVLASSRAQNANAPAQSNCVCVTTAMQQCRPKIAKIGEQFSGLGQRAAIKPSWKSVHDCQHAHFQSPMHEEKSPTAMTVSEQAACFRSFCVNSILLRVSRTRELVHCTANLAATFYK